MTSESNRLTELRRRKGLTRQGLAANANVSERQIGRIEAGDVRIRTYTAERLAKALDVAPGVIVGTQPLPEATGEAPSLEVDAESLKALRKRRGLSRSRLAGKAKVSERQIARLESGSSRQAVRATTMEGLAKALGAEVGELSGATSVATQEEEPAPREDKRMGLRVSAPLHLAFELVRFRYGPTPRQVIELAPLLFVLLAEGSLAWRKKHLAAVDEAVRRLLELNDETSLFFGVEDFWQGMVYEEGSIEAADILGDDVPEPRDLPMGHSAVPFATYLHKMADDLGTEGVVNFDPTDSAVGWLGIWGAEPYEVCRDTLADLTGGSKYARWALVHGDVRLSEVPKELLKMEAKDDRVAWLESKLSDEVRNREERREALPGVVRELAKLELNEGQPVAEAARPAGESR